MREFGGARAAGRRRRRGVAWAVAGLLALLAPLLVPSAGAEPKPTVEEVHARVERLYREAEAATDAYNEAAGKAERQREKAERLDRRAAAASRRLAGLKDEAGALARAQYRGGGVPLEARLLLSDDPEEFVDDLRLARKGQHAQRRLITEVTGARQRLDGYAEDAAGAYERLERTREAKGRAKEKIEERLAEAKELERRLRAEERERLRRLERQRARESQARWLDSGILAEIDAKATPAGRKALAYATDQLGKDYVWGAEGPDTFDCSGLTMRAWEAAGVRIPRTSQTQLAGLPRIDVREMRPGDLIIYHSDASHVGIYAGDGAIVHAPRPGRQVTVAGAGTMPIKAVVRPDA
ncbi:C40 family peptidase [Streptomyces sp. MAR4 CNX-425]|uniref:C40 family peptidase n=1 Tax=Streptomyces sp. MAR4 CNX-425 TaxID=3406343 RepID=UPI003B508D1B